jgi:hypothetical protein
MSLKLNENQLEQFRFPVQAKDMSKNQKVISGVKKNATQAIILSTGVKVNDNVPFIDIRLWVLNSDTEKWIPTPKGLRLTPVQYRAFFYMLKDRETEFLTGSPDDPLPGLILGYLDHEPNKELAYEND